jgi:ubiquinone/menaquinone biosynthesis C-methylase UbiE
MKSTKTTPPEADRRTVSYLAPPEAPEELAWRKHFEGQAGARARIPIAADFLRKDFIDVMRRLVPHDARVLEVGVGDGDTLAALPNAVRHGIDHTGAALDVARARHPGLSLSEADVLTFQRDESYDVIICDRLAHMVPDIQRMLENLSAHLAPGGRVFLSCFNFLWHNGVGAVERLGLKLSSPPANWLSESDLDNLFELAGLEVVTYEDRLLMPIPVPVVSSLLNRYVAKLPIVERLTLYRIYSLRKRAQPVRRAPVVSVVVPTRNEAGNVPQILARTPLMGERTELIFVEGGSTDDTWDAIERGMKSYRGPLEISRYKQAGKGKGDAVRLGFEKATGELLMILDADLTVPPEDLPKFYDAAVSGIAEYVQGTRLVYPMEDEAMRFLNRIANIGFSKLFTYLLNQPLKDTLCGTKVLWKEDYERLAENRAYFGDFDPFGDFDLIFGAARLNMKIAEIPIRYRNRTYGETNISRFRHGWLLLKMSAVAARKLKFV